MTEIIKKYAIVGGIGLLLCAGSFFAGYMIRVWTAKPLVVETPGEIIDHAPKHDTISTNGGACDDVIRKYNLLSRDYDLFLAALPEVTSVTPEKIFFKIYRQKYALTYSAQEAPKWSLSLGIAAGGYYSNGFMARYGGICFVTWDFITGAILIDSMPSVSVVAAVRVHQW